MEFADDIALGSLSLADFDELEKVQVLSQRAAGPGSSSRSLHLSFVVSGLFHLTVIALCYRLTIGEIKVLNEIAPNVLTVEFSATNPQRNSMPDATQEELLAEPTEPIHNLQQSVSELVNTNDQSLASQEEIGPVSLAPILNDAEVPEANASRLQPPSIESVQQTLNALQDTRASHLYAYDCNKLEREEGIIDCAPVDDRNYASLSRNPAYEFHNPVSEYDRSRETVTTIARQSGLVSQNLALNNLPPGLAAYLLEEIELGIETRSNGSSRTLAHINTMVDRSAAGEMARRIFDPWVQQQSSILRSRTVDNDEQQKQQRECTSFELFSLAPAEFTKCLLFGL